jgi:hypothetical protein
MQVENDECCVRIIEQLRDENALVRTSATMFGALAERLNAALTRERSVQAQEDRTAHDSPGVTARDLDGSPPTRYFWGG